MQENKVEKSGMFLAADYDRFRTTLPTQFTTFLTSKKHPRSITLSKAPFKKSGKSKEIRDPDRRNSF
jgi:hypothetical protein